ncbi:barstar family protein [Streptomyces sp. NPDC096198]|uniref:barstar family protein n=1 Tax=Streptomyces sp. NPDC096198 TaxID=3366080 RepID=UPI003825B78F
MQLIHEILGPPLYRLTAQETQDVLLAADDLHGFFVDVDLDTPRTLIFTGVRSLHAHLRSTEGGYLEVLGHRQQPTGGYYLGRVRLTPPAQDGSLSFSGYTCEYPKAGEIWRRWASAEPVTYGEWAGYPDSYHESWLHVVQNAWFTADRQGKLGGTSEVVALDGGRITTKAGLYCALGEAVNGPGGYFGSNLDALYDCLRSSRAEPLFRVQWADFATSRRALGVQYMTSLLSIFDEFRVGVTRG